MLKIQFNLEASETREGVMLKDTTSDQNHKHQYNAMLKSKITKGRLLSIIHESISFIYFRSFAPYSMVIRREAGSSTTFFGTVIDKTPFFKLALTVSWSIGAGKENVRLNSPTERSVTQ